MSRRKIDTLTTNQERATLKRLANFASKNNLELFNVKGSLYDRVKTITASGGRCPCNKERLYCPCPEAITECDNNGECFCRVLVVKKSINK